MKISNYVYILVMALVTYLIRVLPLTLIKKEITNRFIKSFLFYVPYVTLALMTFPAIISATEHPLGGILALIVGIIASYKGAGLLKVAVLCCCAALSVEIIEIIL